MLRTWLKRWFAERYCANATMPAAPRAAAITSTTAVSTRRRAIKRHVR